MNAFQTWLTLSAFERDCFDVCCRLSYDPDEIPTQDRITNALQDLYERTVAPTQVDGALTELLQRSLIAHNQPQSDTLGFTPTKEGGAILIRRHQLLASLTVHGRTADTEVCE